MSSVDVKETYERLLQIYEGKYTNPKHVLYYRISELMREGRTREEAIIALYDEEEGKVTLAEAEKPKEAITGKKGEEAVTRKKPEEIMGMRTRERTEKSEKAYRNDFFVVMLIVLIVINVLPFALAESVYVNPYVRQNADTEEEARALRASAWEAFFRDLINRLPIAGFSSFLFLILYRFKKSKEFLWLTISATLFHIPTVIYLCTGGSFSYSFLSEIWHIPEPAQFHWTLETFVSLRDEYFPYLFGVGAGLVLLAAILEFAQLTAKINRRTLIAVVLMLLGYSLPWWTLSLSEDSGYTLFVCPWGIWPIGGGAGFPSYPLFPSANVRFLASFFLSAAIFSTFLGSVVKADKVKKRFLIAIGGVSIILASVFFAIGLIQSEFVAPAFRDIEKNPFFGSSNGTTWFLSIGFFLSIVVGFILIASVLLGWLTNEETK